MSSQGHQVYVAGFKRQEKILKCLVQRWISTNRLQYNSQGKTQKYSRICCGAIDGCFKLEQSCKRFQIDSKQNFQRGFEISNIFAYYRAAYLHPALPHGNAQFSCMYTRLFILRSSRHYFAQKVSEGPGRVTCKIHRPGSACSAILSDTIRQHPIQNLSRSKL